MKKLTQAEEDIMNRIWGLGPCTVSMLIEQLDPPKPPHSTVSSVFRILEKKGFLSHKAYGRTYEYHPIITKEEYSGRNIKDIVKNYFQGSAQNLVSFLVKDKSLTQDELQELIKKLDDHDSQ